MLWICLEWKNRILLFKIIYFGTFSITLFKYNPLRFGECFGSCLMVASSKTIVTTPWWKSLKVPIVVHYHQNPIQQNIITLLLGGREVSIISTKYRFMRKKVACGFANEATFQPNRTITTAHLTTWSILHRRTTKLQGNYPFKLHFY